MGIAALHPSTGSDTVFDGFAFALPRTPGGESPTRCFFAAVEEIQTPQSSGLAVSCRRRHPAGIGFASYIRNGEFARRIAKGQDTGSDAPSIDQIALAPNSGFNRVGHVSHRSRIYPTRWRRRRLHRCCLMLLAFSWGFTVSEGLTQ